MGKEKQGRRRHREEEDNVGEVAERPRRRRGGLRGGEDDSQGKGKRGKWGERGSGVHPTAPGAQCGEAHFVSVVLLCTHTQPTRTHTQRCSSNTSVLKCEERELGVESENESKNGGGKAQGSF